MEALAEYDLAGSEALLQEVKNILNARGIMLVRRAAKPEGHEETSMASSTPQVDWIRPFFLEKGEAAFYLKLNSAEDIAAINGDLEKRLTNLQEKLKQFLENNDDLEEGLRSKINTFAASNLGQAKKAIKFGLRKKLMGDAKECNSIEDLLELAGRQYAAFIRQELLERILVPLYEGLRNNPGEAAYLFVLGRVNELLAGLGIYTVPVNVSEVYDEKNPYIPSDESQEAEYQTENIDEKDRICAVLRYAYAFREDKGTDDRGIMEGSVITRVYRQGGTP